jgi:hypothetical protein
MARLDGAAKQLGQKMERGKHPFFRNLFSRAAKQPCTGDFLAPEV